MKICTKCEEPKEPTEFNKNAASRDGLQSKCRACCAMYSAENAGKLKARSAKYHVANPERVKAYGAAYFAANTDKARVWTTAWRKKNPEKLRIHKQNRRARKLAAGGKLSTDLAAKLYKLQKGKCPCCNQLLGDDYHLDHKDAISKGGANTDDNIQLLRAVCNHQKHAQDQIKFMQGRGFLI